MQPTTSQADTKAEADRLLRMAENLLEEKDLNAARDFALLAQETEPLINGSDQIIAITDVLIAADKHINHNWYSILQIDINRTDDSELIKQQYRRLALLLHPDNNKFSLSESAFKLVGDAWSVLSNPVKKTSYDNELFAFLNADLDDVKNFEEKMPVVGKMSSVLSDSEMKTAHDKELLAFLNVDLDAMKNRREKEVQNHRENIPVAGDAYILSDPVSKTAYDKELFKVLIDLDAVTDQSDERKNEVQNHREKMPVRRNFGNGASENIWTPCPYCYYLYEYPRVLEGYCLRCQNCDRAFQVVEIPTEALPPTVPGTEAYRFSWPYFPIGFTITGATNRMPQETSSPLGGSLPNCVTSESPSSLQSPGKTAPISRKRGRPAKSPAS
ncbi:putative DnaJ domain, Chaperone J-domain superfamily [Helianthus debilis subsp. tardiflorus]